jgi:hypothetical protein
VRAGQLGRDGQRAAVAAEHASAAQEAARGPAVADPVVEGQRQLGHLADGQLPAGSPGPVDDPAQAQDRYLRVVDPNGMALDDRDGFIYVADSLLSVIWRVSIADGTVSAWARGPQLAPDGGLGANGLKLHDGAVWVSNTQLGTLPRVPIRPDGSAGPIQTIATGLAGIDDFAFTGPGPSAPVLAAINRFSTAVLIRPDGSQQTVLTAADGAVQPLLGRPSGRHRLRAQRRLPDPDRPQHPVGQPPPLAMPKQHLSGGRAPGRSMLEW